jgi:hypothetical protein
MIPFIRVATEAEVESIKSKADLTSATRVWAWPSKESVDIAVIRQCTEIDPMFFAESSNASRKAFFAWGLMNMLRAQGVSEVYFDIDAEGSESFIQLMENMGAEKTTAKPQFRFKMVI